MDPYAQDDESETVRFSRREDQAYGTSTAAQGGYYGQQNVDGTGQQDFSGGDYGDYQSQDNYYQQYYYQQQQQQYQEGFLDPYSQQQQIQQDYQGYQQQYFQTYDQQQSQTWPAPFEQQVGDISSAGLAETVSPNTASNIATATASPITQDVVARFLAAQRTAEDKNIDKSPSGFCGGSDGIVRFLKFVFSTFLVGGIVFAIYIVTKSSISEVNIVGSVDDDSTAAVVEENSRPHIVFLLADDMGWNSMGYQDFDLSFTTPVMTSMAQNGIIMDSFYAQEVCTPARAALLTGRYPLTTGMQYSIIMPTTSWGLDLDEVTLAQVLSDDGYKTHMYGKWHLGHYSPRYLPTARGFDSYVGFLSGEGYYWSKRNPDHSKFIDFMESNSTCYSPYTQDDVHTYSTFLYRDKAIDTIKEHNKSSPLFMYIAFQAVHDPFIDLNHHSKGVPKEYLRDGVYDQIHSEVEGHKRRQYGMALSLVDDAVSDIVDALDDRGMLNHTYIIFASDNGGCYLAGGKNGPLRGSKGSLFEGGVRVDSFIYSPLIGSQHRGQLYKNIFHISDWFPTILNLTGTTYTPDSGRELDSVSHVSNWLDDSLDAPREYLLYNYMYNVKDMNYDMWTNGSFAIRNSKYKLMHTYDSSVYGNWFNYEDTLSNDDSLAEGTCNQALAMTGDFTYYLFDLTTDPYETDNIFDSTSSAITTAKSELYAALDDLAKNSKEMTADVEARNLVTLPTWKAHDDYIVPWTDPSDLDKAEGTFPNDCYGAAVDATDDKGDEDDKVATVTTSSPTTAPTAAPTAAPVDSPTASPTPSPSDGTPTMPTIPTFTVPTFPTFSVPTFSVPTFSIPTFSVPTFPTFTPPTMPTFTPPSAYVILPTIAPSAAPSATPSLPPTPEPTLTNEPTLEPTNDPTAEPTFKPTEFVSYEPTLKPTKLPTEVPTKKPTVEPTKKPTDKPVVGDDDWYAPASDDDWDDNGPTKDDDWDDNGPVPTKDDDWDDNGPTNDNGGSDDDW